MYVCNGPSSFLAFVDEYVDVVDMIGLLHSARRVKFSVKVDRDDFISRFSDCARILYRADLRFPSDLYAVNISRGTAANIYNRIISALDYSERELEGLGDQSSRKHRTISDQKVQFIKAVDQLLSICYSCTAVDAHLMGIHSRPSFEEIHKLLWVEPDNDNPPAFNFPPAIVAVTTQNSGQQSSTSQVPLTTRPSAQLPSNTLSAVSSAPAVMNTSLLQSAVQPSLPLMTAVVQATTPKTRSQTKSSSEK